MLISTFQKKDIDDLVNPYIKEWDSTGSSGLLAILSTLFKGSEDNQVKIDKSLDALQIDALRAIVIKLIWASISSKINSASLSAFLTSLYIRITNRKSSLDDNDAIGYPGPLSLNDHLALPSIIVDSIWVILEQIEANAERLIQASKTSINTKSINNKDDTDSTLNTPTTDLPSNLAKSKENENIIESSTELPQLSIIKQQKQNMLVFCNSLVNRKFIPLVLLKERLELDFLEALTIVSNSNMLSRKEIRARTSLLYVQNKYNLFREESEGYSKLIVELVSSLPPQIDAYDIYSNRYLNTENQNIQNNIKTQDLDKCIEDSKSLRKKIVTTNAIMIWDNIKSLIGYFNLDPNRVLDVIIDLFIANVQSSYDFFIELLSISSWGKELNTSNENNINNNKVENTKNKRGREDDVEKGSNEETDSKDRNYSARKSLVDLIGFKLSFFNNDSPFFPALISKPNDENIKDEDKKENNEMKDQGRPSPLNLSYVVSLLIKYKFINIEELYPYLTPEDKDIPETVKNMNVDFKTKARKAGRFIAQGLAGTLGDEGTSSTAKITTNDPNSIKSEKLFVKGKHYTGTVPKTQKSDICHCLLAIGDLSSAFILLTKFPDLPKLNPDIPRAICRIINAMVSLWDQSPLSIFKNRIKMPHKAQCQSSLSSLQWKGQDCSESVRFNKNNEPSQIKSGFFYPKWVDCVPKPKNIQDFMKKLLSLLTYVGNDLYLDQGTLALVLRVISIHTSSVNDIISSIKPKYLSGLIINEKTIKTLDESVINAVKDKIPKPVYVKDALDEVDIDFVLDSYLIFISKFAFPAISQCDVSIPNNRLLWDILKHYPYTSRYSLYGEWKSRGYSAPQLHLAKMGCTKDCRYIMTRISKDNIKQSGRQIGKVVHSNPVLAFNYIIKQLESYDNMVPHVVDATRYCSEFELDVLTYVLIETLCEPKPRSEENGIIFAPWLKSISSFAGQIYRRYKVDTSSILQYVANRLSENSVYDILVLQDLIDNMTGKHPIDEVSDEQLQSFAGGDALRRSSFLFPSNKSFKRSSVRLARSLVNTGLASRICVLLAKVRGRVIDQALLEIDDLEFMAEPDTDPKEISSKKDAILKVASWKCDQCNRTLNLLIDFIHNTIGADSFGKLYPSFSTFIQLGINIESLWTIYRYKLGYEISISNNEELAKIKESGEDLLEDDDVKESNEKMVMEDIENNDKVVETSDLSHENGDNKKPESESNNINKDDDDDVNIKDDYDDIDDNVVNNSHITGNGEKTNEEEEEEEEEEEADEFKIDDDEQEQEPEDEAESENENENENKFNENENENEPVDAIDVQKSSNEIKDEEEEDGEEGELSNDEEDDEEGAIKDEDVTDDITKRLGAKEDAMNVEEEEEEQEIELDQNETILNVLPSNLLLKGINSKLPNFSAPVLSIVKLLVDQTSSSVWKYGLTPEFYVSYWQLTISDIVDVKDKVERELEKLKLTIKRLLQQQANHEQLARRAVGRRAATASLDSPEVIMRRKKEIERCTLLIQGIEQETPLVLRNRSEMNLRILREREFWFKIDENNIEDGENIYELFSESFINYCIYPRCLISVEDSLFASNFIFLPFNLSINNYPILTVINRLFSTHMIKVVLSQATVDEAKYFGILLNNVLTNLDEWKEDIYTYENNVYGKLKKSFTKIFIKKSIKDEEIINSLIGNYNEDDLNEDPIKRKDYIGFKEFKNTYKLWINRLTEALCNILESNEFNEIRNCILILNKVEVRYPTNKIIGDKLIKSLGVLKSNVSISNREDIKQIVKSYGVKLQIKKYK